MPAALILTASNRGRNRPVSITKNRQPNETLHALAAAALPDRQVRAITESAEKRRILWYDLFLYVTMLPQYHHRQYGSSQEMAAWFPLRSRPRGNIWRKRLTDQDPRA